MTFIYNKTSEKIKRMLLRNNMPKAEIILWSKLKNKQLNGYKFRRQHGIGKFVVDFYSPELKLVIEVDGDSHFVNSEAQEYDKEREVFIQSLGIKFLRFLNTEIYENLDGVLEKISNDHPAPLLSKEGIKGRPNISNTTPCPFDPSALTIDPHSLPLSKGEKEGVRLGGVGRGGQISNQFSRPSRGFTLIELLLVVGILAVVFGLALPFALNTKFTNELDTAAENLRTTLREAQSQAVAAEGDLPYGVYFNTAPSPQKYTLYKGTSYANSDTSFNAGGYGTTELPKSAEMSFGWTATDYEITFERLTGELFPVGTSDKTITLSIPDVGSKTITVTANGLIY